MKGNVNAGRLIITLLVVVCRSFYSDHKLTWPLGKKNTLLLNADVM